MRISTNTIYDLGVGGMQQQTAALLKTQQQVSSGRRILSPADDPVASARVLETKQSQAIIKQYGINIGSANSSLGLEESTLNSVSNLIQDVRTTTVYAGSGILTDSDRKALATDLRSRYQELLGLANTNDGNGKYLFSGYKGATQPFAETSPGTVNYSGDQGQNLIQISPSRQIAVSDSGSDIFERIKTGNGVFSTAAGVNTGTGAIDVGTVATAYDGNKYQINFTTATTYDIKKWNPATSVYDPLTTGAAYASGSSILVGGGQVSISGAPVNGDTFTIAPSTNQSLFTTLNNIIKALETPASSPTGKVALSSAVGNGLANLDNALGNVLTVRASIGARMNELDSVKSTGEDLQLQYTQVVSQLEDVDYNVAITDLTRQQTALEAAQKSYLKLQGLSLFSMM
jgi:flagellar hook-associated protein 3 FlgL